MRCSTITRPKRGPSAAARHEQAGQEAAIVVGLLVAACSCLVLIGLGTWQHQRKAWKEGLIAALDAQLARAAQPQLDW